MLLELLIMNVEDSLTFSGYKVGISGTLNNFYGHQNKINIF